MTHAAATTYELYYWPHIQGRGEFVRLALEDAGVPYVDVARLPSTQGGGAKAVLQQLAGTDGGLLPFAPPLLKHESVCIAQTAVILQYLGPRLGLAPAGEAAALAVHQLQLTLADWVTEVHDTHHPVGSSLRYEEQTSEARRRAHLFVTVRAPKFFRYFEHVLQRNPTAPYLVGNAVSYADLSLFQMVAGLRYAFPRAMTHLEREVPRVVALHDHVAARPNLAVYLASPRRIAFNEEGLFRHYPELDVEGDLRQT